MITEINEENVLELLQAVVEEVGEDYVYPESLKVDNHGTGSCIYVNEDLEPLCIIGRVVAKTSADLSGFHGPDQSRGEDATLNTRIFDRLVVNSLSGLSVTENARSVLTEAQFIQDNGATFGQAYATAQRVLVSGRNE